MYYGSIGRNKHKCVTNEYRLHKQTIEHTEHKKYVSFSAIIHILNFHVSIDLFIFVLICRMCWNLFKMCIRGKRIGGISSSNNIEEDKKK